MKSESPLSKRIKCTQFITLSFVALASIAFRVEYPYWFDPTQSTEAFGPACGAATIDGVVKPAEWSSAAIQTISMQGNTKSITATLYVMNGANNLFLGITVEDNEFSSSGQYLPTGDAVRIDFDNDHSGELFSLGDDVLIVSAGKPQFSDAYISNPSTSSATNDVDGGGASDGLGGASRVGNLNHFEVKHSLCSGDERDFCLHPGGTVGFRVEYLDAEANGSFGGSFIYPGPLVTSTADIVFGPCSVPEVLLYLPLVRN